MASDVFVSPFCSDDEGYHAHPEEPREPRLMRNSCYATVALGTNVSIGSEAEIQTGTLPALPRLAVAPTP